MVTIQSAESNRSEVKYISESVWGTTPAAGVVRKMRITSSGLVASKKTVTSDEIRADRMVPSIVEVGAATGGDVNAEASAFSQDDFYQQFLLGAWSLPMLGLLVKGSSVAVTGVNTVTLSGADWTKWLVDNQYLKLEGFATVANNGYVRVNGTPTFSAGNTVILVDETLVVEAGSAFTKLMDAGDVILKSTLTAFTSGNTINGGGANSFAGQNLQIGQKLYIEGLGKETGTITVTVTDPTEGDTFVVNDGVDALTFEIRTNAALVAPGNVHVAFSGTEATLATNIAAAINNQFRRENLRASAVAAAAIVTVKNHRGIGGTLSENTAASLTVVNFSGGDATKFGFRTIQSIPNDDTIVVAETLTTDANGGGLTVVIKGSHLRNPGVPASITKQSVSMETSFTDVDKNLLHDGCRTGTLGLSVSAGEIVKVSMSFMGRETQTLPLGTKLGNVSNYTVLDTTATEPWNATSNVGELTKNGAALTTAITAIEINAEANLREQPAVGSKFPAGIGYGRFSMSGTVNAYFQNFDLYNDFINHTTVALAFNFEDADHIKYFWTLPAVKFTANPVAPGGIDQDIMEPIEWSAQRDPVLKTMLMLDRFSSIYPASIA